MQSIGTRLEEARKRRGISIREAADVTKIRTDFLQAFEDDRFHDIRMPEIYVRGFLRSYAAFLKINADKIVTDFNAQLLGGDGGRPGRRDFRESTRQPIGMITIPEPEEEDSLSPSAAPVSEASRRRTGKTASKKAVPASRDEEDPIERSFTAPVAAPRKPSFEILKTFDRDLYLKVGIIVVSTVLVLVTLTWIVSSVLRREAPSPVQDSPTASPAAVTEDFITILARADTRIKVTQVDGGRVLFEGPLLEGERRRINRQGSVLITYLAGRNLQVEKDGVIYAMTSDGIGRDVIP